MSKDPGYSDSKADRLGSQNRSLEDENRHLQQRLSQLEGEFARLKWSLPPEPDNTLAQDEWYAIFSDYRDVTSGLITKMAWPGGSNMTAVFKVKRIG